uniref:Cullin-5 n=1 Tax=Arcella intermedia TaxID=1963864 RepID=A0A6B2KYE1_9EUKA
MKTGLTLLVRIIQKTVTEQKITVKEYMDYYNKVFKVCTDPRDDLKDQLYGNLKDLLTDIVNIEEAAIKRDSSEEGKAERSLLIDYLTRFGYYSTATKMIRNIFRYMHNYWIPQKVKDNGSGIRDVYEMSLVIWREKCYGKQQTKLLEELFDLITAERDGKIQDKSIIVRMRDAYISIGVLETQPVLFYKKDFEEPFIQNTRQYYTKESNDFLQGHSVSEYMKLAETRLAQEEGLSKAYLHENTTEPLVRALEDVLITQHNQKMQDEFPSMLREDRNEDMKRFFSLLRRIPNGLNFSSETMEAYLASISLALIVKHVSVKQVPPPKVSIDLLGELITMHQKYTHVVAECFENNPLFLNAIDKGFRKSINDENKTKIGKATGPEMIVYYCDHILKGGAKLSEAEFDLQVDTIMKLFTYLDNKDLFYSMFQKLLAQRLLDKKSKDNLERSFIAKLKETVGDVEVNKLQVMFNDIRLSEEKTDGFKEFCKNHSTIKVPYDTTVMVLNNYDWPSLSEMTVTLSPQFNVATEAFTEYYRKIQGSNRVLKWQPSMANCVLNHIDDKGQKRELTMTAVQASIMILIYENDKLKFDDIRSALAVPDGEKSLLKFTLAPLMVGKSKTPLLEIVGDNKNKELEDDDVITWLPLKCKERKLVFQKGVFVEAKPDEDIRARLPLYDAALVRVMKARHTATIQELFGEASTHLIKRFKPDQKVMRKRLEYLIDKGYMRYDPDDRKKLNYLA